MLNRHIQFLPFLVYFRLFFHKGLWYQTGDGSKTCSGKDYAEPLKEATCWINCLSGYDKKEKEDAWRKEIFDWKILSLPSLVLVLKPSIFFFFVFFSSWKLQKVGMWWLRKFDFCCIIWGQFLQSALSSHFGCVKKCSTLKTFIFLQIRIICVFVSNKPSHSYFHILKGTHWTMDFFDNGNQRRLSCSLPLLWTWEKITFNMA